MNQKKISRSKEDYIKAIYAAIKKHGSCRNMDVSKYLSVSKSSTCIAIKKLEQEGFVVKDDWRILLTEKGQEIGCKLYEKDNFFADWFKEIGVSEDIALKDACRIEHAISEETYTMSRLLGAKDEENAKRIAADANIMSVLAGIIILAVGFIFINPLLNLLGANASAELFLYSKEYLYIILVLSSISLFISFIIFYLLSIII